MMVLRMDGKFQCGREQYKIISSKQWRFLSSVCTCLGLRILPDSRCVTLGNWFQDIYRHAFYFIGKLLHVSKEFPQPSHFFSGAIWTAFYMVSVQDIRECNIRVTQLCIMCFSNILNVLVSLVICYNMLCYKMNSDITQSRTWIS